MFGRSDKNFDLRWDDSLEITAQQSLAMVVIGWQSVVISGHQRSVRSLISDHWSSENGLNLGEDRLISSGGSSQKCWIVGGHCASGPVSSHRIRLWIAVHLRKGFHFIETTLTLKLFEYVFGWIQLLEGLSPPGFAQGVSAPLVAVSVLIRVKPQRAGHTLQVRVQGSLVVAVSRDWGLTKLTKVKQPSRSVLAKWRLQYLK